MIKIFIFYVRNFDKQEPYSKSKALRLKKSSPFLWNVFEIILDPKNLSPKALKNVRFFERKKIYCHLYSGGELWEDIWNQTHLVVFNFCPKRLHHVTISHDKARSNRWSIL